MELSSSFRSTSVLLANLAFEGCVFNDSEPNAIIEIAECESSRSSGSIRLHHVIFEDNELISGVGLRFDSPSCSPLEMARVEFVRNKCNGVCGAVLSLENDLRRLRIKENVINGNVNDIPAILFAPEGSETKADSIFASENNGTVFLIEGGSLILTELSFSENDVGMGRHPTSACIHLIDSDATIKDSDFNRNEAETGAAIYADHSDLTLINCRYEENKATYGGALLLRNESLLQMEDCNFTRNSAIARGGAVYTNESSSIIVLNFDFNEQSSFEAGCFYVENSRMNCTSSNFMQNFDGGIGGVLIVHDKSLVHIKDCQFSENSAVEDGGMVYVWQGSKLIMDDCMIRNGIASGYAGAVLVKDSSVLEINRTVFENNTAAYGACISVQSSTSTFITISAQSNKAYEGGFVHAKDNSSIEILFSNFTSNEGGAGGIVFSRSSTTIVRDSFSKTIQVISMEDASTHTMGANSL